MTRTRVVIESPYKGDVERNIKYLKRALLYSLTNDEAHLLVTYSIHSF